MNVWLCPIKPKNWRITKAKKIFGVRNRELEKLRSLKLGDLLVFHLLRPDKGGIVAICRVVSVFFEEHEDIWGKNRYPFRVRIEFIPDLTNDKNDPLPLTSIFGTGSVTRDIEIVPFFKNVSMIKISENQYRILQKLFQEMKA